MYVGRSWPVQLVRWYVDEVPRMWWQTAQNLGPYILEMFGVKVHAKYMFEPMFHDRTFVGRLLSFCFRSIYIYTGALVWFFGMMIMALAMPIWFGFHVIWLVNWQIGLLLEVVVFMLFWWRWFSGRPWGLVRGDYSWEKLLDASPGWLAGLLQHYPYNLVEWWKVPRVEWWLHRLGVVGEVPAMEGVRTEEWARAIWESVKQTEGIYVTAGDVIKAWAMYDPGFQKFLQSNEVSMEDVVEVVLWSRRETAWFGKFELWDPRFKVYEMAGFDRAKTGVVTPVLDMYSVDLTSRAHALQQCIGREHEYTQLLELLGRSSGENALVLGPEGIGKSTFVSGLAKMIMKGNAPKIIAGKRLVKLEAGRLLAGTLTQGESAGRMLALLDDIRRSENIILFIDQMHTLMTAEGASSGVNMFSILEEALTSSKTQVIGTTTDKNFKQFIEPNAAFLRMFEVMRLQEPDYETALLIMQNVSKQLEVAHRVVMSWPAIKAGVTLSSRYIQHRVLPEKGKTILDEAAVKAQSSGVVLPQDVAQVITERTGIPVQAVGDDEREKLLDLEKRIHEEFIGQDVAVQAVADALRRARLDVGNEQRPIGTFMFVGPTGVGKTELSRQLAKHYFGSKDAMVRLDMTEFSQAHMINRLIGSPVGTQGYGSGGELTELVRRQPFCLILLDEIEKAHPKVWDLLMQVIDDGRLTDSTGMTVSFAHTIIIATSNAVTNFIRVKLQEGMALEEVQEMLFDELTNTFRVEFLNRFDAIVPFAPLDGNQMEEVVRLELEKLKSRLAGRNVEIMYDQTLLRKIAELAVQRHLGARPVRRIIQDKLEAHVAREMLRVKETRGLKVKLGVELLG